MRIPKLIKCTNCGERSPEIFANCADCGAELPWGELLEDIEREEREEACLNE